MLVFQKHFIQTRIFSNTSFNLRGYHFLVNDTQKLNDFADNCCFNSQFTFFHINVVILCSPPTIFSLIRLFVNSLFLLEKSGTSKISLAVYRIIIKIRTVCHRQRQRRSGEVGRVQETFLLNTEGRLFEFCLKSYFHTYICFIVYY